jgi:hypothetical protein
MAITSVSNPRWANESQTIIDCDITTDITGSEIMPFTASINDPESCGRQVFEECIGGKYGPIAKYSPPPPPPIPPEPTTEQNKRHAESLLAATDWTMQPDVRDESVQPHLLNVSEFKAYRAAVRAIAVDPQPGYLEWPSKPVEQWS